MKDEDLDNKTLTSLRVVDLKEELEERGLSKSGSKKDLVERLKAYLKSNRERKDSAGSSDQEAPNTKLNVDKGLANNDFIKQYLAKQQAQLTERKASFLSDEGASSPEISVCESPSKTPVLKASEKVSSPTAGRSVTQSSPVSAAAEVSDTRRSSRSSRKDRVSQSEGSEEQSSGAVPELSKQTVPAVVQEVSEHKASSANQEEPKHTAPEVVQEVPRHKVSSVVQEVPKDKVPSVDQEVPRQTVPTVVQEVPKPAAPSAVRKVPKADQSSSKQGLPKENVAIREKDPVKDKVSPSKQEVSKDKESTAKHEVTKDKVAVPKQEVPKDKVTTSKQDASEDKESTPKQERPKDKISAPKQDLPKDKVSTQGQESVVNAEPEDQQPVDYSVHSGSTVSSDKKEKSSSNRSGLPVDSVNVKPVESSRTPDGRDPPDGRKHADKLMPRSGSSDALADSCTRSDPPRDIAEAKRTSVVEKNRRDLDVSKTGGTKTSHEVKISDPKPRVSHSKSPVTVARTEKEEVSPKTSASGQSAKTDKVEKQPSPSVDTNKVSDSQAKTGDSTQVVRAKAEDLSTASEPAMMKAKKLSRLEKERARDVPDDTRTQDSSRKEEKSENTVIQSDNSKSEARKSADFDAKSKPDRIFAPGKSEAGSAQVPAKVADKHRSSSGIAETKSGVSKRHERRRSKSPAALEDERDSEPAEKAATTEPLDKKTTASEPAKKPHHTDKSERENKSEKMDRSSESTLELTKTTASKPVPTAADSDRGISRGSQQKQHEDAASRDREVPLECSDDTEDCLFGERGEWQEDARFWSAGSSVSSRTDAAVEKKSRSAREKSPSPQPVHSDRRKLKLNRHQVVSKRQRSGEERVPRENTARAEGSRESEPQPEEKHTQSPPDYQPPEHAKKFRRIRVHRRNSDKNGHGVDEGSGWSAANKLYDSATVISSDSLNTMLACAPSVARNFSIESTGDTSESPPGAPRAIARSPSVSPPPPSRDNVSPSPPRASARSQERKDRQEEQSARIQEGPALPPLIKRTITQRVNGGMEKPRDSARPAADMVERLPSPARHQSSAVVFVRNLVRPFTVAQLKELLARTGTIVDFWIDNIKSKCYCQYETEEQAVETRTALHRVRWPASNPKLLLVDFASLRQLSEQKSGDKPPPARDPPAPVDPHFATRQQEAQRQQDVQRQRRQAVREWDKVKMGERSPGEKEREREHKRTRETIQEGSKKREDDERSEKKRRDESSTPTPAPLPDTPVKLLDDLFRKTITTPCIYWLPLTIEQIEAREQERKLRALERQKRLAEREERRSRSRSRH